MDYRAIRALRRRRGWTQADLAARLGTDAVTVSRWERGASRPRPSAEARLRELAAPPETSSLVRVVGEAEAARLLRRALLLACRLPPQRFAAEPAGRLRAIERALDEQLALKARARISP